MRVLAPSFAVLVVSASSLLACASKPPPPPLEPVAEDPGAGKSGPMPAVSQELGSIDQKQVEKTFAGLVQGPLENCHKQGRDRIEVLTGDVKVFLRIDSNGKVRYGFFEETTMGDRETEKCILGVFSSATWPKPEGGEAEVRSGFGWGPGGEREPTTWPSDKVTVALVDAKDVKKGIDKCRAGVKGDFRITAYVEASGGDGASADIGTAKAKPKAKPQPAPPAKPAKHGKNGSKEPGGKFKAIGAAPPNKEGAEKVDCIVDALKALDLPSPGSYPAKVSFTL